MEKARIIETIIKQKGYSLRAFAEKCEMPYTSLYTMLKRSGVNKSSVESVIRICKELGITVEYLEALADGEDFKGLEITYDDIMDIITNYGRNLSPLQKQEIIKSLLSD